MPPPILASSVVRSRRTSAGWETSTLCCRKLGATTSSSPSRTICSQPAYVERCVAALEANPRAILAFSDITLVKLDGSLEQLTLRRSRRRLQRVRRAQVMARLPPIWWTPNRGVFRASAAAEIGGLRRSRAGEFSADWPWLLHMSLLGEFVRIPEPLCTKIFQPDSLSKSWRYSRRDWIAVAASAAEVVWRAEIPAREKLLLAGVPASFVARRLVRVARRAPRWLVRRLRRRWVALDDSREDDDARSHSGTRRRSDCAASKANGGSRPPSPLLLPQESLPSVPRRLRSSTLIELHGAPVCNPPGGEAAEARVAPSILRFSPTPGRRLGSGGRGALRLPVWLRSRRRLLLRRAAVPRATSAFRARSGPPRRRA